MKNEQAYIDDVTKTGCGFCAYLQFKNKEIPLVGGECYTEHTNLRCGYPHGGGFKVKKRGTCKFFTPKQDESR